MPLILVTGLPSSGKSTTSEKIYKYLQTKLKEDGDTRNIRMVSDSDHLEFEDRNIVYSYSSKEKELRAMLKSDVQRFLSLGDFVILDCAAYIKGYRYELHCISKEAKTQYCVVETSFEPKVYWEWNNTETGYSKQIFDGLVERYEKCCEENRWDSPLLKVSSSEPIDLEKVYQISTKGDPLKPNKCTSNNSTTTTIYRYSNK